jgi:hypothetical protein
MEQIKTQWRFDSVPNDWFSAAFFLLFLSSSSSSSPCAAAGAAGNAAAGKPAVERDRLVAAAAANETIAVMGSSADAEGMDRQGLGGGVQLNRVGNAGSLKEDNVWVATLHTTSGFRARTVVSHLSPVPSRASCSATIANISLRIG